MKQVALSLIILAIFLSAPAWPQNDQVKGSLTEHLDNLSKSLDNTLGALENVVGAAVGETAVKAKGAADKALEATVEALGKASEALTQARDDLKKTNLREYEATVQSVADGDTLVVRTADAEDIKIRLYGLDAPESGQEGGQAAAKALSPLQGLQVKIREMGIDRDSLTLALVEREGKSVNIEQVKQGQAWYYPQNCQEQPICAEMAKAEKEAQEAKRGLWSKGWFWQKKADPVPPWEWRRRQGETQPFLK